MEKILTLLPALGRDIAGLIGVGLLLYGIWEVYRPAAFIVAGLLLLSASLMLARGED